jgi:hypothetical protein
VGVISGDDDDDDEAIRKAKKGKYVVGVCSR